MSNSTTMETTLITIGEPKDGIFGVVLGSTSSSIISIGTVSCEKTSYKSTTDSGVWDIDGGPWCWVIRNTHGTVVGVYGKRAAAVDGLIKHHDNERS